MVGCSDREGAGGSFIEGTGLGEGPDRSDSREGDSAMGLWCRLAPCTERKKKRNAPELGPRPSRRATSALGRGLALETEGAGGLGLGKVEGEEGAVLVVVAELDIKVDGGGDGLLVGGGVCGRPRRDGLEEEARGEEGRVGRVSAEHFDWPAHLPIAPLYTTRPE